MAFKWCFPPVPQNTLKLESQLCPALLSQTCTYKRQAMACEGERSCLKLEGRSTHELSSSMTLHHSPPCSCSIEQRGENVGFPPPRGRDTHPSTSTRCSEISSSTEGEYSLQSFNIQVISARDVTLPLGPSRSRKQRRQQLPSWQGLRGIPAPTRGLTANRSHSKWQFCDLQYRKSVTVWTNCF